MSHAYTVLMDNALRNCWYGQGPFGVSKGLKASADMKGKLPSTRKIRDSCKGKGKGNKP